MLKISSMRNSRYWPSAYNWKVPANREKLLSIQTNFDNVIIGAKIPPNKSIADNNSKDMMIMFFLGCLDARFDVIKI